MGCFFDISTIKKTNVSSRCTYRLWFRMMGQLALHVRFPNVSHEPLWARNVRPLRFPDPWFAKIRGRPSLAAPLIGIRAHGARPHVHPAVTVGGPCWHSVRVGLHVLLVLGQYCRIVVIMRLTNLATTAIAPLFVSKRTIMGINSCTSPRSHIGTSIIPSPTTMGADPGVISPYTSLMRTYFARFEFPRRGSVLRGLTAGFTPPPPRPPTP